MPTYEGLEYVKCNACGVDDTELVCRLPVLARHIGVYNRDEWEIVRCRQCGLIYENPRPDTAALQYFYTFNNSEDLNYAQEWFVNNADLNQRTWRQILRAMQRIRSAGKLLDVGCGAGSFLIEAQKAGYDVIGQDVAPFFIDYCRTRLGLTVYDGELENLAFKGADFDCVTALDVIEHHPDPRGLLTEIRRLLKPGGLFVITTHDIGNFFARLYGPRWRHMYAIGHLTYFTRSTMIKLLETSGFRVAHVGGAHTIDRSGVAELKNRVVQFVRLILLRGLILGIYKPLSGRITALARWQYRRGNIYLDHSKLLLRAGDQVIMDDNMVILALAK